MDIHSELAARYIIYSDAAERARRYNDWPMYHHCIETAAFWFVAACFGKDDAKRML